METFFEGVLTLGLSLWVPPLQNKLYHYSLHACSLAVFLNALAYLTTAVSYAHKMFMELAPVANVIKLFMAVSYIS